MIETNSENHAYILLKNINKNKKVDELIKILKKHNDFVDSYSIDNSMNLYLQFKKIETVNQLLEKHKSFVDQYKIQIFQVNKLPLDLNQTSKIVLVTFYKEKVAIDIKSVCQFFSSYGKILKIVMFKKKNYQAFIEFETGQEARNFKQNLHNRNFRGMFFLKIQFTQKKFLVVKDGNPLEYDFTQQYNYQQHQQQFTQPNFTLNFTQNQYNFSSSYFDNRQTSVKQSRSKRVLKVNYIPKQCEHLHLYNICSIYGQVSKVSIFPECSLALVHFVDEQESQIAQKNLNGIDFFGNTLKLDYQPRVSDCLFQNLKEDSKNTVSYTMHEQENLQDKVQCPSQILLVSNLPQQLQLIDLQNIFKIFSKIERYESIGNNAAKFYFESLQDSVKIISLFQRLQLFNRKINLSFENPVKKNRKSFSLNNLNALNQYTDWNIFFEQFTQKQSFD